MTIIYINNDYSWSGQDLNLPDCDQTRQDQFPELHVNYGCQNPGGLATVWANCHVGTGP